ncbi:MAG: glycosyltransferase family 4 protein [Planctomycetota bacterium]
MGDAIQTKPGPVVLYARRGGVDHFAGVPERLGTLGIDTLYERADADTIRFGDHAAPGVVRRAGAVAFADLTHNLPQRVVRQARRYGVPSVLLVDGVLEWANTFRNRWLGTRYLRPPPEDVALCSGPLHADLLEAMGARAVTTGLPRLHGFADRIEALRHEPATHLLVATANYPAADEGARARLLAALQQLRDAAHAAGVSVLWRLRGGLCEALGVEPDEQPLAHSLASARALITSASTIAIEGMLAGVPTGVLHPHPWPNWVPAAWTWRPRGEGWDEDAAAVRTIERQQPDLHVRLGEVIAGVCESINVSEASDAGAFVDRLMHADDDGFEAQGRCLRALYTDQAPERVAEALNDAVLGRFPQNTSPIEPIGPTVVRPSKAGAGRRALSIVVDSHWPTRGIARWSTRLGSLMASRPDLGWTLDTLWVATDPPHHHETGVVFEEADPRQHLVTLEPTFSAQQRLAAVHDAVCVLRPDVVIPNETDLGFAAAMQARGFGARPVLVAHPDAWSIPEDAAYYDRWVAAIAPTETAPGWLESCARDRPVETIPYGVPITDRPRSVSNAGPLRLAFVGLVMQEHRRVFDLIDVLAGLEARGVDYRFELVGDGPDLEAWRERARGLDASRVAVHGRRSPEWLQRLWTRTDVTMLVSEREGASLTLLEAMGQGVAPCVTAFGSGAAIWLRDGEEGIVSPVGEPDAMAARLAALATDRAGLAAMGEAAWRAVRAWGLDAATMAERYAAAFDRIVRAPAAERAPTDLGLRLRSRSWPGASFPDHWDEADDWVRSRLDEAGYRSIATGRPTEGCDAVIVRAGDARPSDAEIAKWRGWGFGVALSPDVHESADEVEHAIEAMVASGVRRIAIASDGVNAGRVIRAIEHGAPIVGWVHPLAESGSVQVGSTQAGLPVVEPERAASLEADGLLVMGAAARWAPAGPWAERSVGAKSISGHIGEGTV